MKDLLELYKKVQLWEDESLWSDLWSFAHTMFDYESYDTVEEDGKIYDRIES